MNRTGYFNSVSEFNHTFVPSDKVRIYSPPRETTRVLNSISSSNSRVAKESVISYFNPEDSSSLMIVCLVSSSKLLFVCNRTFFPSLRIRVALGLPVFTWARSIVVFSGRGS